MQVQQYGDHAVLLECPPADVPGWTATARELFPDALDVVPGARTVLVDGVDPLAATGLLVEATPARVDPAAGELVEIPVAYDGADLAAVADVWRCSPDEVVRRHRDTEFSVAFCGFSPGFAYLAGLPEEWSVPRLATPRTRVPAGAVGLAGRYSAIYPTASPGGWQLIGRTDTTLWSVDRDPPALLTPGVRVRFVDA